MDCHATHRVTHTTVAAATLPAVAPGSTPVVVSVDEYNSMAAAVYVVLWAGARVCVVAVSAGVAFCL